MFEDKADMNLEMAYCSLHFKWAFWFPVLLKKWYIDSSFFPLFIINEFSNAALRITGTSVCPMNPLWQDFSGKSLFLGLFLYWWNLLFSLPGLHAMMSIIDYHFKIWLFPPWWEMLHDSWYMMSDLVRRKLGTFFLWKRMKLVLCFFWLLAELSLISLSCAKER